MCKLCNADHVGRDHRKHDINEIPKVFTQIVQKRIQDADAFHKTYKSTDTGKFYDAYVEFFDKCKESINQINLQYDKEEPFNKQGPAL